MNVLRVLKLNKSYRTGFFLRPCTILRDISFELEEGSITGFLGSNGSGKTTTLKCILMLSFPESGKITYFGSHPFSSKIKEKIGFLPEQPYFYKFLTGAEFLKFHGGFYSKFKKQTLKDRIHEVLKKVGLFEARDQLIKNYSRGMLQRIGIAQAFIHEPRLLILDEPLGGLDPHGRLEILKIIKEVSSSGASVLLSSHLLQDAEEICDHYVILDSGKIIFSGKAKTLLNDTNKSSEITFLQENKIKTERTNHLGELQSKIDKIRKYGGTIVEIKKNKKHLKDVFNELTGQQNMKQK